MLKSSVYDLSNDIEAVGARSDLAISVSFSDCSYSNFAIIRSGLFFFDNSIAEFKLPGRTKLITLSLTSKLESDIGPIIFS